MKVSLKIWRGMQVYVFRDDAGKLEGYLGMKIPVSKMTAQQILESI